MDKVVHNVVELGSVKHFVFECEFLLIDLIDFLDEVWLPAEKLDCLNVVKALVDVEAALLALAALLFTDFLLSLAS